MTPFSHRPLAPEDLPILCGFPGSAQELYFMFPKATWPLTTGQLARAAAERREPTVFLKDGQPAGYANFVDWAEGDFCELGNVVVAASHRRQGLAGHMIRTMAACARDAYAAKRLRVGCFSANVGGLLFYTRQGFAPVSIQPRTAPDGSLQAMIKLEIPLEDTRA